MSKTSNRSPMKSPTPRTPAMRGYLLVHPRHARNDRTEAPTLYARPGTRARFRDLRRTDSADRAGPRNHPLDLVRLRCELDVPRGLTPTQADCTILIEQWGKGAVLEI